MEHLIHRARAALGAGVSESEAARSLMKSGFSAERAFLAVRAAEILLRHDAPRVRGRMVTTPSIPVLLKK